MASFKSMWDIIYAEVAASQAIDNGKITLEEWTRIRRGGDPDEIAEAVERMEAAGGYDNLE